jgi:hypothetical protein
MLYDSALQQWLLLGLLGRHLRAGQRELGLWDGRSVHRLHAELPFGRNVRVRRVKRVRR